MNWTRSLVASAALATCALVGVASVASGASGASRASSASPASPAAPIPASIESGPGDYKVEKTPLGKGVKVKITVKNEYHINKAYPVKWNKVPVSADKVEYSGGTAEAPLVITVTVPESHEGTLKFGYCASDGSNCSFGEVDVK